MENVFVGALALVIVSTLVVMAIGAGISIYFQRKTVTADDWAMGSRKLPSYVIVFTQFATLVGGGVLVGHVSIGYNFGIAPLAYGVCGAAGCFIMAIIAKWLRENEFTTIPDILEKVYGKNNFLLFAGSIMAMVVPFGWIASQITSFGKLYASITGIDMNVIIVAVAIICVLFTIPSGFNAVAWSDFVFGVIMLGLCTVTAVLALNMGGGWSNIVAKLPDSSVVSFPSGLLAAGIPTTILWFVAATPGMMTNQMTFQRVCATDTVKNARRTLIIGGILIAAIEIWVVIIGNTCRALNPGMTGEDATGWFLTQIPVWAVAMFSGFIATTIITTTDSAIQSVSVNVTRDIYKRFINGDADDKKLLRVSRMSTIVVAILAVLMAITFPQVLNLIIASYAYSASGLLVPIYCGYIFRNKNILTPISGIVSMIGGVIGCAVAQFMNTSWPYAIYGIGVSFICLVITGLVTRKKN
ncbi:MAG: sodium:solute symporter family protein [Lachnospiraceae bacterium]|nr:sodium:solute symporter family protein [Lachnospiraceae bacterium]